jgi:predicted DNA-binding transcriptional regulator AlpA
VSLTETNKHSRRKAQRPQSAPARETAPDLVSTPRLLNRHDILAITGMTYPTIWAWMRAGAFPRCRISGTGKSGSKSVWLSTDVERWMAALPMRKLKGDV